MGQRRRVGCGARSKTQARQFAVHGSQKNHAAILNEARLRRWHVGGWVLSCCGPRGSGGRRTRTGPALGRAGRGRRMALVRKRRQHLRASRRAWAGERASHDCRRRRTRLLVGAGPRAHAEGRKGGSARQTRQLRVQHVRVAACLRMGRWKWKSSGVRGLPVSGRRAAAEGPVKAGPTGQAKCLPFLNPPSAFAARRSLAPQAGRGLTAPAADCGAHLSAAWVD